MFKEWLLKSPHPVLEWYSILRLSFHWLVFHHLPVSCFRRAGKGTLGMLQKKGCRNIYWKIENLGFLGGAIMGKIVPPQKTYWGLIYGQCVFTLFGNNRPFIDLIKLRLGRTELEWALLQHDYCPYKKRKQNQRHREEKAMWKYRHTYGEGSQPWSRGQRLVKDAYSYQKLEEAEKYPHVEV